MTKAAEAHLTRSRGMRDLLPEAMRAFRLAEDAFRASATRWGYEEIRTPAIENYSLFTWLGALTPEMLGRVYSFLDWDGWSGERVVLRPDSTVPVSRAFRESGMSLPARLFYVQNVFRFTPGGAEDRETWQFGVEYFDPPPTTGDVETLLVAVDTLVGLGLSPSVALSHAGLMRTAVGAQPPNGSGTPEARPRASLGVRPIVELLDGEPGGPALADNIAALMAERAPDAAAAATELAVLARLLGGLGVDAAVQPALTLDFEYYSGPVFEIRVENRRVASGGRYTPPAGGAGQTACGFAIDADDLTALLHARRHGGTVVGVVPAAPGDVPSALAVARQLHAQGISATIAGSVADHVVAVEVHGAEVSVLSGDARYTAATIEDLLGRLLEHK
jgi:histidyl-tRNA synthetase